MRQLLGAQIRIPLSTMDTAVNIHEFRRPSTPFADLRGVDDRFCPDGSEVPLLEVYRPRTSAPPRCLDTEVRGPKLKTEGDHLLVVVVVVVEVVVLYMILQTNVLCPQGGIEVVPWP